MNEVKIALENIERDCGKCRSNCEIPPCCTMCSMHWAKEALRNQLSPDKLTDQEMGELLEKTRSSICDEICKWPVLLSDQEQLDKTCEKCIVEKGFQDILLAEYRPEKILEKQQDNYDFGPGSRR